MRTVTRPQHGLSLVLITCEAQQQRESLTLFALENYHSTYVCFPCHGPGFSFYSGVMNTVRSIRALPSIHACIVQPPAIAPARVRVGRSRVNANERCSPGRDPPTACGLCSWRPVAYPKALSVSYQEKADNQEKRHYDNRAAGHVFWIQYGVACTDSVAGSYSVHTFPVRSPRRRMVS